MKRRNVTPWPWFAIGAQSVRMLAEAQIVIARRLQHLAAGGPAAQREAVRMVEEKVTALTEAQQLMFGAASRGKPEEGARKVVGLYAKRVRANRQRLAKPPG